MKEEAIRTAQMLHQARLQGAPVEQFSQSTALFSSPEKRRLAYAIQDHQLKLREDSSEQLIGWKMGLTSEAKRKQMNLDSPLYGHLTDRMQIGERKLFELRGQIHPKIEPEIAFIMKKELSGQVSREQAFLAIGSVCAALEILDSRYKQFKYFSMEDVIADNSSSSFFVLGPPCEDFSALDLAHLSMKMMVNNELAQAGTSKDISGDPVISIVQLSALLSTQGRSILPGQIVLAGAATQAVALEPRMNIQLDVQGLKSAVLKVGGE